jgi:8-oxo-dGTP pyrophosphatase MutT (NUDIX family)
LWGSHELMRGQRRGAIARILQTKMAPNKACPILFRDPGFSRILVFKHPSTGVQLVKGTIESGEPPADAALRELREEAGISNAKVDRDLGTWVSGFENQI